MNSTDRDQLSAAAYVTARGMRTVGNRMKAYAPADTHKYKVNATDPSHWRIPLTGQECAKYCAPRRQDRRTPQLRELPLAASPWRPFQCVRESDAQPPL